MNIRPVLLFYYDELITNYMDKYVNIRNLLGLVNINRLSQF